MIINITDIVLLNDENWCSVSFQGLHQQFDHPIPESLNKYPNELDYETDIDSPGNTLICIWSIIEIVGMAITLSLPLRVGRPFSARVFSASCAWRYPKRATNSGRTKELKLPELNKYIIQNCELFWLKYICLNHELIYQSNDSLSVVEFSRRVLFKVLKRCLQAWLVHLSQPW